MTNERKPTQEQMDQTRKQAEELSKRTKARISEMMESIKAIHGEEVATVAESSMRLFSSITAAMFILGGVLPPDAYNKIKNSLAKSFNDMESTALSIAVMLRDTGKDERSDEDMSKEATGLMRLIDQMKNEEINFVNHVEDMGHSLFNNQPKH